MGLSPLPVGSDMDSEKLVSELNCRTPSLVSELVGVRRKTSLSFAQPTCGKWGPELRSLKSTTYIQLFK